MVITRKYQHTICWLETAVFQIISVNRGFSQAFTTFISHPCFWCLGHPSLPGLSNVNWSYNLRLLSIAKCLAKLFLCKSFQKSYVEIPLTIPAHIQRYWHRENWPQIQIPQECSCGAQYRSEAIKVVFTRHYPIS